MNSKRINRIVPDCRLTSYMGGRKNFPEEIGDIKLEGEQSGSEIAYYSWDLKFKEDTDAKTVVVITHDTELIDECAECVIKAAYLSGNYCNDGYQKP